MSKPDQGSAEDRLIARYFRPLDKHPGALGFGDDAAVLTPHAGCDLVLTTDGIVAGVQVCPDDEPGSIGRKALRMDLSALAAKGAPPRGFPLALSLPGGICASWLAAFATVLGQDAEPSGCPLQGGGPQRPPGPSALAVAKVIALGSAASFA